MIDKPKIFKEETDLPPGVIKQDVFEKCLKELFFVENPQLAEGDPEAEKLFEKYFADNKDQDVWIYFPWVNKAIRIVIEYLFFKLRTARNRNLITSEEQGNYRNLKVGIVGLSVGSGIFSNLVLSGGPKTIKIADFDVIEGTNLNRIQTSILNIGSNKAEAAARQIWECDPFADIHVWSNGISEENIGNFIAGEPKINIFIDEMDDLYIKFLARIICRQEGIPVIMATDVGDMILLDVERFDLEPDREPFHGFIKDVDPKDLKDKSRWVELSSKIIGPEFLPPRLQRSLLEKKDKKLSGVPQLGTTAMVAGAAVSLAIRRIASNQRMLSGRYIINLEAALTPDYNSEENANLRLVQTHIFKEKLFGET